MCASRLPWGHHVAGEVGWCALEMQGLGHRFDLAADCPLMCPGSAEASGLGLGRLVHWDAWPPGG